MTESARCSGARDQSAPGSLCRPDPRAGGRLHHARQAVVQHARLLAPEVRGSGLQRPEQDLQHRLGRERGQERLGETQGKLPFTNLCCYKLQKDLAFRLLGELIFSVFGFREKNL